MTRTLERQEPAEALQQRSAPVPSVADDGARLQLAGGKVLRVSFSVRTIIRVETQYKSHTMFLLELQQMPLYTLAWVLLNCAEGVKTADDAMDLLEGADWQALVKQVDAAWHAAFPAPADQEEADPTTGS